MMVERIRQLIRETEQDLHFHRSRRDTVLGQRDREREGIEALACAIRLKALRQCLAIVEAGWRAPS